MHTLFICVCVCTCIHTHLYDMHRWYSTWHCKLCTLEYYSHHVGTVQMPSSWNHVHTNPDRKCSEINFVNCSKGSYSCHTLEKGLSAKVALKISFWLKQSRLVEQGLSILHWKKNSLEHEWASSKQFHVFMQSSLIPVGLRLQQNQEFHAEWNSFCSCCSGVL